LRRLRPASREQLSKLFHVEKHEGNGKVFIGKFWTKKNPAEAGFSVAGLFGDFVTFRFEVLYKTFVHGFDLGVIEVFFDLLAQCLKSFS